MLRALVVLVVFACSFATVELALAAGSECSKLELQTTGCPTVTATVDPDEVILNGTQPPRNTAPNLPDTPSTPPGTTVTAPDGGAAAADPLADCADPLSTVCVRPYIATVTAPITLADIAAFRPIASADHMEPNGWAIAGLDTNFYATGGAHIVDGTLLGQPASVRFTPVEWHWSYGDGSAASHPYPGGTWAAQDVAEFGPTPTSHVYGRFGTYSIDLDVEYAAEYRFAGGPWVGIAGTLTVPANRLVVTVGSANTVLVERECTRDPAGPGC